MVARTASFRNWKRLRAVLEERLARVPRLVGTEPVDPSYANELSSRIRTRKRRTVLALSFLGVLLALILVMVVVQSLR